MGAFGERLKKEREQRNLSVEDIAQTTKISARNLRALEAEDFANLPGGVFNRGFVRAYARHLGVDEESLIKLYLDATGDVLPSRVEEPAVSEAAAQAPSASQEQEPGSGLSLIRLAIGGVALAVIVLTVFWFLRHRTDDSATRGKTYAQPSSGPRSSATPFEPKSPDAAVAPLGTSSHQVVPQRVQATSADNTVITQAAAQSQMIPGADGGIELNLHALDEVWLSAAIDGQPAREDTLFTNNRRTLRAREKIVLKVGNAGSLEVTFNGKKMSSLGDDGQVRTLTFLPSGVETSPRTSARAN